MTRESIENDDRLSSYDFDLPPELIARRPAERRDESRLMTLGRSSGEPRHLRFGDIVGELRPGDRLVVNDSAVLPARLEGVREATGGRWSGLFLRPEDGRGDCFILLGKTKGTPQPGERVVLARDANRCVIRLIESRGRGEWLAEPIRSDDVESPASVLGGLLAEVGRPPLPPYILKARRDAGESRDEASDRERYQTVYADRSDAASIAAPTAGLHFSKRLLERLRDHDVELSKVRLHVGEGTFRPVSAENLDDHRMHTEFASVSEQTVEEIRQTQRRGGRIIAVGTTAARTLESAAASGTLRPMSRQTDLFIRPGFRFRVVDGLVTNFHLPKSTLLVLVAALVGRERMHDAYREAVAEGYRFYSYGDAMLIL